MSGHTLAGCELLSDVFSHTLVGGVQVFVCVICPAGDPQELQEHRWPLGYLESALCLTDKKELKVGH